MSVSIKASEQENMPMQAASLTAATIHDIAESAAYAAAKNPNIAPADVYPHFYQALSKHAGVVVKHEAAAADDALEMLGVLHAARVALDNCVQVFSNDLAGLKLIQPELKCASQALATVEASIEQLSKSITVPFSLSDQLNQIEGRFPYDDAPLTTEQSAALKAKLKAEFPAPLICFACQSMGIRWGAL
jgi:hypothetical protein